MRTSVQILLFIPIGSDFHKIDRFKINPNIHNGREKQSYIPLKGFRLDNSCLRHINRQFGGMQLIQQELDVNRRRQSNYYAAVTDVYQDRII